MSVEQAFRAWLVSDFGVDPGRVVADGKWHRFNPGDTKHKASKPAAYLLHADGKANGLFMDWRGGKRHKWFSDGPVENIDREEINRRRDARRLDRLRGYQIAADEAVDFWRNRCTRINDGVHAYLADKGVQPCGTRQGNGSPFGLGDHPCVVVPISDGDGRPVSLQAIREDGERRFWPGSAKEGGHFAIGEDDGQGPVIFCEGFSTGATIWQATKCLTIVCLEAGNMTHVGLWAKHKYHGRKLIVAGDDDWHLVDHPQIKRNVGREAAEKMARNIGGVAIFPDMLGLVTQGGDDFNDMAREYGLEDVAAAFLVTPEAADPIDDVEPLPGEASPGDWTGKSAPHRRFIIDGWIVRGACGLLSGQEGVGKSLAAQQMATCAALGLDYLGLPVERVNSVYITCEDPLDELWRRQESINAALGITMADLDGKLLLVSLVGQLGNELGTFDSSGRLTASARYEQIHKRVLAFQAGLVFLDNAAHFFSGNENARHDVAAFLGLLERLSGDIDGAVVLLAHPNKQHAQGNTQGNEYSGSTGWSAHVRNRLFLDWEKPIADGIPANPDGRILRKSKANYGKKGEEISFVWHNWAFTTLASLPPSQAEELARVAQETAINETFLRCLDKSFEERRNTSSAGSASNYAPRQFSRMTEGRGIPMEAFEQAMNRLMHLGVIVGDVALWKRANRTWVSGVGRAEWRTNPCTNPAQSGAQSAPQPRTNPSTNLHCTDPLPLKGEAYGGPPPGEMDLGHNPDDWSFDDDDD